MATTKERVNETPKGRLGHGPPTLGRGEPRWSWPKRHTGFFFFPVQLVLKKALPVKPTLERVFSLGEPIEPSLVEPLWGMMSRVVVK